jgi:CubicO group peptidase (beta-lactamase class C family)
VIILRLVQDNYLSLDDHPQTWLSSAVWPMPSGDPLSGITLSHLLSFTSGLKIEPDATASPAPSPAPPYFVTGSEILAIANLNMGKTTLPGSEFYYNSNHLQVAGLMAIKARDTADAVDFTSWKNVFDEFKAQTGLFTSSAYDLPPLTPSNPRLAGGMHWTASDYMAFLRALAKGQLLNSAMMAQLLADYTPAASVTIGYSPLIVSSLNEDWHYGYGLWQEYQGNPYAGTAGSRVSCPGAYGAYPFWDISHGYFGIVARQGPLGTFPEGVIIERSARTLEEQWAALP